MLRKSLIWIFALALVSVALVYLFAWKSPKYFITANCTTSYIIPFSKYDSIADHPRPLIIEIPNVVVFGASHTRDPRDSQIAEIEFKWKKLNPTIALVEGRLGFLLPGIMNPVKKLGEGGKVKALASKAGVPVYNWDLSKEELAARLKQKFTPQQIAVAQILSPYFSQMRFGKPSSPEKSIEEFLSRAKYVGLENNFRSATDVDREWKKYFPAGPDWRNVSDETTLPGYLNDYLTAINELRNQQLVCAIQQLRSKGERIFVICGSSHAACIQYAINH